MRDTMLQQLLTNQKHRILSDALATALLVAGLWAGLIALL